MWHSWQVRHSHSARILPESALPPPWRDIRLGREAHAGQRGSRWPWKGGAGGGGGGGGGGGAFREKWLLQKAKTWSNRGGLTLTQHRPNVWAAERPFMWNNIDVGCKATIIKLGDGSLWVHSPVELDDDLRKALADIGGEVKHIVSPNYEHVKFAKQWIDAFPDATGYGCPGAKAKYPSIGYDVEVPTSEGQLPSGWPAEIQPVWFDCEKNPFTGKPFFNEVNFVHTPSKTLLTTDTFWNYPSRDAPFGTRAWKVGMDKVLAPLRQDTRLPLPSHQPPNPRPKNPISALKHTTPYARFTPRFTRTSWSILTCSTPGSTNSSLSISPASFRWETLLPRK